MRCQVGVLLAISLSLYTRESLQVVTDDRRTDFVIASVYIFWNLHMSMRMRLGLCTLTGGGVMYVPC